MVEQIYSENTRKIIKNKKIIEETLKVKLSSKEKIIFIEGEAENEYICLQAIEAINLGFSIKTALLLKDEDIVFKQIPIKSIAKRRDMSQIRARIIGTNGRVLDTLESLTDCFIAVHNNKVGIIGSIENIKTALYALENLIAGSKHASVYAYLEKKLVESKTTSF